MPRPTTTATRPTERAQRSLEDAAMPQEKSAIVLSTADRLANATYHDVDVINARLREAYNECNLIAPATRVGSMPPGYGVAFSVVYVNPSVDEYGSGPDVHSVDGGKLSLHKHVFDRIATALGVTWVPRESHRTDDRSDPYYCAYKAVGVYRSFDMQWLGVQDDYDIDLNDASVRVEEALENARNGKRGTPEDRIARAHKSIRQMRKFILQRAATGARTRALACVGLKRSYTRAELEVPFVVAKLHFDGHSDDPAIRMMFAQEIARQALPSLNALYGGSPASAIAALPALPEDTDPPDDDDSDDDQPAATPPPKQPARQPEPVHLLNDRERTPVTKADTAKLERSERRIDDDLTDNVYPPDEVEHFRNLLEVIRVELRKRSSQSRTEKY
jgi:hypothetical protein